MKTRQYVTIFSVPLLLLASGSALSADRPPVIEMQTNLGTLAVRLDYANAPTTADNFVSYVKKGFYENTLFHRVVDGFVIQGGGVDRADMQFKTTDAPIKNEADNGKSNLTGTIAMARTSLPDSATTQFFINMADNTFLDYAGSSQPGYAVFGKVIKGMPVARKIERLTTYDELPFTDDAQLVWIDAVYANSRWNKKQSKTRIRIDGKGTVISDPRGINCGTDCFMSKTVGGLIKLTAKAAKGYAFSGWRGDCQGMRRILKLDTNKGNHNCTARFIRLGNAQQ